MKMIKLKIILPSLLSLLVLGLVSVSSCNKDKAEDEGQVPVEDNLPDITGYPIVGTNQVKFYNNETEIPAPLMGTAFYGQNAQYTGNTPSYVDNGDGTVTDMVTGLMWSQSLDLNGDGVIDVNDKMSQSEALAGASTFNLAGHTDWRLPNIKEQYSLILFSGVDPSGYNGTSTDDLVPFMDTEYFRFNYGDVNAGERIIDAQFATTTIYVDFTMMNAETMFGANLADGRIKGYPKGPMPGQTQDKQFYVYYVRGNTTYGENNFVDNTDGTISDNATGLMWMKNDAPDSMIWADALAYAEGYDFAGHSDWRLPDVKELQSIVDYTRSPSTTNSAAIDPLFNCKSIINEKNEPDFGFYWSSTTHANMSVDKSGTYAAYVCFGRAMGYMQNQWMDVHGAGAQRSDPKTGNPADFPNGHGPQGDAVRIFNYVRLVRNIN